LWIGQVHSSRDSLPQVKATPLTSSADLTRGGAATNPAGQQKAMVERVALYSRNGYGITQRVRHYSQLHHQPSRTGRPTPGSTLNRGSPPGFPSVSRAPLAVVGAATSPPLPLLLWDLPRLPHRSLMTCAWLTMFVSIGRILTRRDN
jgi:hypothetical protein